LRGRVGILGGTFDPIHDAHLAVGRAALAQLGLRGVLFVPNGTPPDGDEGASGRREDRVRMVELAVEGEKGFDVSRVEVDRDGISYTIDTLRALRDHYGQAMCFILGADRLVRIDRWKEPEAIVASVPLVVAPRSGIPSSAYRQGLLENASIWPLRMREVDLSSTALREKAKRGESIAGFVPAAVAAYIEERGLYRDVGVT
jgi:nicotinate-nucleotide adenylyltransferase